MIAPERIAHAMSSHDLSWHDDRVSDVDMITALGMCSPLGAALWSVKFGNRPEGHREAVQALLKLSAMRMPGVRQGMRLQLAVATLREYLLDVCPKCSGRNHIQGGAGVVRICPGCSGSGVRRYSDADRARMLKVSEQQFRLWRRYYEQMLRLIQSAEAETRKKLDVLL